ncbi:ribosome small subunit-dependent GTPase A [Massilia sp. W12]|uniref:ribosome small subunit-dependent GTPase A n=1 Tax=Massilia sp. W12 TaxID=3126507 RepID=UPI0030D1D2BD
MRADKPGKAGAPLLGAQIIAAHGRHYLAQSADGQRWQVVTRGKKTNVAVGDMVQMLPSSKDQAVIEQIDERRTLLYRSDQYKSKLLAANLDQIFIVTATEPGFSDDLVSRALVAAESAGLEVVLILNKTDLSENLARARERIGRYAALGYPVLEVSARQDAPQVRAQLLALMQGKTAILIGQSGMGKSTLINLLVPDADIATREISAALDSGRHTTTFCRMYSLEQTRIIDSPGFQEFGLYHLSEGMLERAFREFAPHLGACRFYNCHHRAEPGCAILHALEQGQIAPERHALYLQLLHESSQVVY